jgi:hypothetical protein
MKSSIYPSFSRYYWEEFAKVYQDVLDWSELSRNPNITFEIFIENRVYPWDDRMMITNPNVTLDHIIQHRGISEEWCIENAIKNPNITLDDIIRYDHIAWSYNDYLMNPNLCLERVLEDAPFIINDFDVFFLHQNFRFQPTTLLKFPDYHWNWKTISQSPCIDYAFVRDHPELPWNLSALSLNPKIRIDDVIHDDASHKWDYVKFSENPSVDATVIRNNPLFDWKVVGLLRNPNLCFSDVIELCGEVPSLRAWHNNYDLAVLYYTYYSTCLESDNLLLNEFGENQVACQPTMFAKKTFSLEKQLFHDNMERAWIRNASVEEELIERVFHPSRFERLLQLTDNNYELALHTWIN